MTPPLIFLVISTRLFPAATLLAFMLITGMVQAQVTNVIYQDDFARVGPLDGSTPSPVNTGGATWKACNAAPYNAVVMTDGLQLCLTNSPNPTNGFYLNGFLPFTPQVGHIYILSCKMRPLSAGTNWLTLGFATGAPTNNNFGAFSVGADWMLVRGDGTQVTTFRGPGIVTPNNFTAALGSTTNVFTVVLDTTTGNANYGWTFRYYTNGVQMLSSVTPFCNFPIKYAGLSAYGATGYFQQFTLTDVLMSPSAPSISEDVQSTTAQVGQTATFWVGVTGDYPTAAYQWMTNGPSGPTNAIPGATNGSYTTPALDVSYDGLSYSVIVTNDYGSITSASATLTVVSGPPTVYSATKTASPTSLVVAFSKAVDPITGLNAANYSLSIDGAPSGVSILSANYGALSNSVILTTSMLDTNAGYYLTVQHVKDLFGTAMAGSIVPVLPANLVLYLRADSGVIYDNSGLGLVVQWLDQTTNGNNAAQYFGVPKILSGLSARPTTNNINGQLALSFGPTKPGTFLLAPSSPSLESMVSNTTMYSVAQFSAISPANEIVNKTWGNIPAPFDWIGASSQSVQYGNGGNNAPAGSSGATFSVNTPYVLTSMITFPVSGGSTNFNFYLNGNANGSGAIRSVVQGLYDGGQPLWVGGRSDLQNGNMKGQIAEIMLFNTALSGADRTNVDNYLGAKYFPFVITTDLPASTTTSNGFAVTYTFAASLGSTHGFSIQWQKNGINIPGANDLTYTTPILGPVDNGAKFAVKVTLPNGSFVYSSTNILTVLTVPPYVTWAGIPIWNTNQVIVLFDEAVDPATATVSGNYLLNNGANVLSAAIGDTLNKVVLTTSPLTWNANPGFYSLTVQNVQDMFGNTIVTASSPVGLYPSAALWVRADNGVLTNSDGTVFEWDDLSGNGNNLSAIVAPQLATSASGDPVIRFTATNGTYMTAASSPSLGITGDMAIIAAVNFATLNGGTNGHIVSKAAGTALNIAAPYDYYFGTPNALVYRGNGGNLGNGVSYGNSGATSGPPVGIPCVVAMSETGDIISHYVNGKAAGSGLLSNGYHETGNADGGNFLSIGARQDLHNRLVGDMSELIVANMPVSSADMSTLATYLASQHHIVLFNTAPTILVFSASGGRLTLSWPADHTGWQLQSNSVALTSSSAWFTVAGSTVTNQMVIMPDATKGNVFYRLLFQP
jgi:hypothetical protein